MELLIVIIVLFIIYPIIIYPIIIIFLSKFKSHNYSISKNSRFPTVTVLCVVHNGEKLIENKIINTLNLDYPKDKLNIVISSDGSSDNTIEILNNMRGMPFVYFDYPNHEGKISAINKTVSKCDSEIIVFTDVDTMLDAKAIENIIPWFDNKKIGGVCGRKVIIDSDAPLGDSQIKYVRYEDSIRLAESKLSSIASNEGKLYAIRKELIDYMPLIVTDDLFNCLNVISKKYKFIYEPKATGWISAPVRDKKHEIERRRRIVGPSLYGIFIMRRLLNPFKYGIYSYILLSHKVLRRFIPFFLLLLFIVTGILSVKSVLYLMLFILQVIVYFIIPILNVKLLNKLIIFNKLNKINQSIEYFILGNIGTLLGVFDFILGIKCTKWEPKK